MHPGEDGNNRTAAIILNTELVKHKFPPSLMEDPNRLEGFSQEELYEEVVQGMRNFEFVVKNGIYPGGEKHEEILASPAYKDFFKPHPEHLNGPIKITNEQREILNKFKLLTQN